MDKVDPIGGQAVIEGVMIRAKNRISVAVRKPNGEIAAKADPFISLTVRVKILALPFIRGIINLFEMMVIGIRALNYSAEQALEEENGKSTPLNPLLRTVWMATNVILSIGLALLIFKFIPLFLTEQLRKIVPGLQHSVLLFNLTDGLIRIGLFFAYIGILSLFKDFRRIFEYHGAEHKTIFAYEKGLPLTIAHTKKESPRHPRCGTSFLIIVLIISILLFSLVPRHPDFVLNFLRRLAIIPVIAGVAYEILKFTAKYERFAVVKLLTYPGILTQYITTKEPDEKQLEVAIAAVSKAVN